MTTISRNRPNAVLLSLYSINWMCDLQHGRPIRCDMTRPFDKRTIRVLDTASSKISVTGLGNDRGLSFGEISHVTTGGKFCLCYRLGSGSFATCWIYSSKNNAACAVEHLQSSSRIDGSCRNSLGREFESFQCLYTESNKWPKRVVDLFPQCRCAQGGFSHNPYAILLPFCARILVSQRIEYIKDIKQSLTRMAKFGLSTLRQMLLGRT